MQLWNIMNKCLIGKIKCCWKCQSYERFLQCLGFIIWNIHEHMPVKTCLIKHLILL